MNEQQSLIAPGIASMSVPIDTLIPHPRNSRKGDIPSIMASLQANQQYAPLVVQRGSNFICKGNHTWLAAKELGWSTIAAIAIDCEDEEALQILETDNLTSDKGKYDDKQRKINWDIIAEYRKEVRAGRRNSKLAPPMQEEMDLLVADELERLHDIRPSAPESGSAMFGETEEEYARRVEIAGTEAGGEPGAAVEAVTLAKAMGFREAILVFNTADYARILYMFEKMRKKIPELSSNSAAVMLAMNEWYQREFPEEPEDWTGLDG